MSSDTPIYDATCRAVGPPPHEQRAGAEQAPADDPSTAELPLPAGDPAPPDTESSGGWAPTSSPRNAPER